MFDNTAKISRPSKLWILVGNADRARLFESGDVIRHAVPTRTVANEGQDFALQLSEWLDRAFNGHEFDRLVLVLAPKLLGELREVLSPSVAAAVTAEYDKDLIPVDEPEMTNRVRALPVNL